MNVLGPHPRSSRFGRIPTHTSSVFYGNTLLIRVKGNPRDVGKRFAGFVVGALRDAGFDPHPRHVAR